MTSSEAGEWEGGCPEGGRRASGEWKGRFDGGGAVERCWGETCITCSDEGVPMRVVAIGPGVGLALCEGPEGRRSEVMTGLVVGVAVGDVLLVHAGTALIRLEDGDEVRRRVP